MNKKVLGIVVVLMAVAMLATPVMAIGIENENAEDKNKNVYDFPGATQLRCPSGVLNELLNFPDGREAHNMIKNAAKFRIGNAIVLILHFGVFNSANFNKWMFLSNQLIYDFMMFLYPLMPGYAQATADAYPVGWYMKVTWVHAAD